MRGLEWLCDAGGILTRRRLASGPGQKHVVFYVETCQSVPVATSLLLKRVQTVSQSLLFLLDTAADGGCSRGWGGSRTLFTDLREPLALWDQPLLGGDDPIGSNATSAIPSSVPFILSVPMNLHQLRQQAFRPAIYCPKVVGKLCQEFPPSLRPAYSSGWDGQGRAGVRLWC